jgi:UDPglucose--hexose-1-phosphate uridylyltransferase
MFPAARRDALALTGIDAGYGVHEVVVECPHHETSLAALSPEQVRDVFTVYRDRLRSLCADQRLQYVQLFKNHGAAAGASVEHAHAQILGVARVPRVVGDELQSGREHYERVGRCIFCDLILRETSSAERLIELGEHCVAFTAYAGRFPYETWVMPRRHGSHFDEATDVEIAETADSIHNILRRLERLVDRPSYNLILHTAPLHDGPRPDYHWHWEIVPRLTGIAGFELATGWFLNPLPPELAAGQLRGR